MMRTFLAFFVLGNKLHHLDPNKKKYMPFVCLFLIKNYCDDLILDFWGMQITLQGNRDWSKKTGKDQKLTTNKKSTIFELSS